MVPLKLTFVGELPGCQKHWASSSYTSSDCASGACPNPILPNILKEKKLTSGYMGIFSSAKPKGKCSHGGGRDLTSTAVPRGGINKDERRSDNVAFHTAAVNAATAASLQLLEDIRLAVGDNDFLRMMGIARSSVKKGTQDEPSEYILVPFNDPSFGPMIRTTDPDKMKKEISKLKATGGGDIPEMCLSGLQLALTGAPALSYIYVFTDAIAEHRLKDGALALPSGEPSVISRGRGKWGDGSIRGTSFSDYKDLALASGGWAIQVSRDNAQGHRHHHIFLLQLLQCGARRNSSPSVYYWGSGGRYSINARNDRNFPMSYPNSLHLGNGQYTNSVTITPPASTPSGTDITLTMEAKSSSGVDSNDVVVRLSVVTKITDFFQPLCEVVSVLAANCPQDVSQCRPFQWELSANLTDGNGTGIESISLRQGNGTALIHTSLTDPITSRRTTMPPAARPDS
ncbi:von Willebrand factor A domain-containing protein 7-like protein [Lates japonicus]|uniref:von Willebrand factor A domain-containing protein 7-like protein n=1 Tax=Lates japonicus TaxID=270547 RepID=A0AAD3R8G9_LATJO|nr:von Willebrand factor A domain-containing protein 7-like protein [Lates japonicus]